MILLLAVIFTKAPGLKNSNERKVIESTKIYDRTGSVLLYDVHGEEKRTVVAFSEIPRHVKNATIALEDDGFYRHFGIQPLSLIRVIFLNALRGMPLGSGGSTITQQLVKNTLLRPERTFVRKFKEIVLAIKIERLYKKDEILDLYLNQIPYGNNAYGIEAAAETFFGKHAGDLSIKEAAYLAALPKAPSYYSPYGKHRNELAARAEYTVNKMKELGFISEEEFGIAVKERINFAPARKQGIVAPHFVLEVVDELNKKFGEDTVESGGFKIITTLNTDLQIKAEGSVAKFSEINEKNFNAYNAGLVAIDPKTGDILALVGSKDYFGKPLPENCSPGLNCKFDPQVNITLRQRQPGSAFKPFVYATAFKRGYTPETVLFDVPTEFNPSCEPDGKPGPDAKIEADGKDQCYHPRNFDEKFRGPVTLRESLAQSLNVPSVKVLYLAGLENALSTARDFGITTLNDPARYGLTLVLGGGEVSLMELSSAYGVFANDGVRNNYRYILKIEDAGGKTIYEANPPAGGQPQEAVEKNIARAISDILSDNKARAPSFGEFSALYFPNKKVAAKTGTTNDFRDAWVLGYTPDIVAGAWVGNSDNSAMEKRVAGFIVAPLWHDFMEQALVFFPESNFVAPDQFLEPKPVLRGEWRGDREFVIDKISKKLATNLTPESTKEKKVVQEIHSILYWLGRENDSQFKNWERQIRLWAISNGYLDQNDSIIPKEYDDVHTAQNMPQIIKAGLFPQKQIYSKNDVIVIKPALLSFFGIIQADYFLDENYLGSSQKSPFDFVLNLEKLSIDGAEHRIKIKIYDSVGNTAEYNFLVNIK